MKKIIIPLFLVCLMAIFVSSAPQVPYIMYGHVNWNDQLLSGSKIDITLNGVTNQIVTDENGYWTYQLTSYSNGDVVTIKAIDGCGSSDTCTKSVTVGASSTADYAVVDFSLTGVISGCPSVSCGSCGGGGGSSCTYTATKCKSLYPDAICDDVTCPAVKYTEANCRSLFPCPTVQDKLCPVAPACPAEKECEVNPIPSDSPFGAVIAAIITALVGGGAVYVTLNKTNKVKVIKKNGIDVVYHQHPSVSGYHSPDVMHREEMHKKGELVPKYAKDSDGKWRYV